MCVINASADGSAGLDTVRIKVGELRVAFPERLPNQGGLHVVVVNPSNGSVVIADVFDTKTSATPLEQFIMNDKYM